MDLWRTVLGAVAVVFMVTGAGVILRRLNWLTEQADQSLMALVIRLLMPCLILHQTLGNPRLTEWRNIVWPPLLGFGTLALGIVVAWVWVHMLGRRSGLPTVPAQRTFVATTGMHNYGYIPIPLVTLLFTKETSGILFVHNVGVELALWTAGVLAFTGGLKGAWWKRLINPCSITVVAALAANSTGAHAYIPGFVANAVGMLGTCAIPVSLLLVGATIADELRQPDWHKGLWVMASACILRLGVLPVMFIALAWVLPISDDLKRVLVVEAAMPAAMFPIVMTRHYAGDSPTALRVVVATTLVGLVTIPLWISAGLAWLRLHG